MGGGAATTLDSMTSALKALAIGLGVAGLGVGLVFVWFLAALSGGIDDLLDVDHPREGDPEVVAAEQAAYPDLTARSDEVVTLLEEAASVREVGGGQVRRPCVVGQHNVKIDDDYDLACSLAGVHVLVDPGGPAPAETVRTIDEALTAAGWRRVSPLDLEPVLAQRTAGWYQLPPLRYQREGSWELLLEHPSGSSVPYEIGRYGGVGFVDESGPSWEELLARTPRTGYAVVAVVGVEYFRE